MGSRVPGSGRLRGDLAGKVARQIANVYMEVRAISTAMSKMNR